MCCASLCNGWIIYGNLIGLAKSGIHNLPARYRIKIPLRGGTPSGDPSITTPPIKDAGGVCAHQVKISVGSKEGVLFDKNGNRLSRCEMLVNKDHTVIVPHRTRTRSRVPEGDLVTGQKRGRDPRVVLIDRYGGIDRISGICEHTGPTACITRPLHKERACYGGGVRGGQINHRPLVIGVGPRGRSHCGKPCTASRFLYGQGKGFLEFKGSIHNLPASDGTQCPINRGRPGHTIARPVDKSGTGVCVHQIKIYSTAIRDRDRDTQVIR